MSTVLAWLASPTGLLVLAILDSSVAFFLPLALDLVVILLAARDPELFWLFPLLATAGSLVGAATTHWIGERIGEAALPRFIGERKLKLLEARVAERGAMLVGAVGLIPPPFPFTWYVLAAGALGVGRIRFLAFLAGARLVRTGVEASIASRHGEAIVGWMDSTSFQITVAIMIATALIGTGWITWRAYRAAG